MTVSNPVGNPLLAFSPEVSGYLEAFARRHSAGSVLGWLDRARDLRVLVVGEAIIDQYHYCETMGKSGKEPILATRYLHAETFAGGALAVANHVAAFCDRVAVLTVLGSQGGRPDPTEGFVRAHLNPSVEPVFLYQEDAPTIVKRRYLESYPLQKLFEVYYLKHMEEDSPVAGALCRQLRALLPRYDVVIVTDYGHGMLVPEAVQRLCAGARFLAVNTQANADNHGFNTVSKYPRADFASLSEKELRLEVRCRQGEVGPILREVAERLDCRTMLVTRGSQGNVVYDRRSGIQASPVLSERILDRVGAGDAVLSAAALCVAQGAPAEVLGFLGNVVGAQAVATVGHHHPLDRDRLAEHVLALLG
jgi:bifunctional ADP-heptose synthase (sugar kinase/adenylyltransferase)